MKNTNNTLDALIDTYAPRAVLAGFLFLGTTCSEAPSVIAEAGVGSSLADSRPYVQEDICSYSVTLDSHVIGVQGGLCWKVYK